MVLHTPRLLPKLRVGQSSFRDYRLTTLASFKPEFLTHRVGGPALHKAIA